MRAAACSALQVSFHKLVSEEAYARLSMARPLSSMQEAGEFGNGFVKYNQN